MRFIGITRLGFGLDGAGGLGCCQHLAEVGTRGSDEAKPRGTKGAAHVARREQLEAEYDAANREWDKYMFDREKTPKKYQRMTADH